MIKLKELRQANGLTQNKLANKIGLSRSTIAMYETEGSEPDIQTLSKLANFFNVSIDYLLGKENDIKAQKYRIPVLGIIPAGVPIEAIEDILDYEEISPEMLNGGKEYFALKIKGDSMAPNYLDGDVVIFLKQDYAENNDDCCVYVNGYDATFKKIRINNNTGILTLQPINSSYEPLFFNEEQIKNLPVRIIGKAVEIRRKI